MPVELTVIYKVKYIIHNSSFHSRQRCWFIKNILLTSVKVSLHLKIIVNSTVSLISQLKMGQIYNFFFIILQKIVL